MALSLNNPDINEAKTAALMAVQILDKFQFLKGSVTLDAEKAFQKFCEDKEAEEVATETLAILVTFLVQHPQETIGIATLLDAVLGRRGLILTDTTIRRRIYHRIRWRLMGLVQRKLLVVVSREGFRVASNRALAELRPMMAKDVNWA